MSGFSGQHTRSCLPLALSDIMLGGECEEKGTWGAKTGVNAHLRRDIMFEGKRCTWPEPTVISGRKVEPVQCANTFAKILKLTSQCKHF